MRKQGGSFNKGKSLAGAAGKRAKEVSARRWAGMASRALADDAGVSRRASRRPCPSAKT